MLCDELDLHPKPRDDLTAKVEALIDGRYNVSKNDLRRVAVPSMRHRLITNFEADADGITAEQIVEQVVQHVDSGDRDPVKV